MKTNAARLLDSMKIEYELRSYEVDPEDLSAETVARKVGLPLEQVFKTLVARGDRHGVCFAVVPGNCQLDLKAIAKLTDASQRCFFTNSQAESSWNSWPPSKIRC